MSQTRLEDLPEVLRPGQVIDALNISYSTLDVLVESGAIPSFTIPGMTQRRFLRSDIAAIIEGDTQKTR